LEVELCKELQSLEVALERGFINVAVEIEQSQKLQFHLVEQLCCYPTQFRIVRVLEVKIIEVFCPHQYARYHQPVHVTARHVKIFLILLNTINQY
jgi:hypothetical protein